MMYIISNCRSYMMTTDNFQYSCPCEFDIISSHSSFWIPYGVFGWCDGSGLTCYTGVGGGRALLSVWIKVEQWPSVSRGWGSINLDKSRARAYRFSHLSFLLSPSLWEMA